MNSKNLTIEDLIKKWKKRPYSWSQHSSWDWDKDQWYESYMLGNRGESSAQMEFGNTVGDSLGTKDQMIAMPTLPHKEYEVRAKLDGTELVGYFDFYEDKDPEIQENKTSSNTSKWTIASVATHGQLDFYGVLLYLPHRAGCSDKRNDPCPRGCVLGDLKPKKSIKPEKVKMKLYYIPVNEGSDFEMEITRGAKVSVFPTGRTTAQIFKMMVEIKKRRKEMEAYARKRLKDDSDT